MDVNIYIAADSASPKTSVKWYGYVLECIIGGQPRTRAGFGHAEATNHQITLTAIAAALGRLNKSCEVHLYSEDVFVLSMLEKNLDRWAYANFTNAKGKPVANQAEWMRIWELSQGQLILTEPGKHTYSKWLKAEMERRKQDV